MADIVDGESLARVREAKRAVKAGKKGLADQSIRPVRPDLHRCHADMPLRAMDLGCARHSRGYQRLDVKVGLVSYGVVHLLVAWIALNVAFGKRGDASPNGALKEVAQQPLGEVLLVMAVGLFVLTIWQLIEATVGRDDPNREGSVKGRARLQPAGPPSIWRWGFSPSVSPSVPVCSIWPR